MVVEEEGKKKKNGEVLKDKGKHQQATPAIHTFTAN